MNILSLDPTPKRIETIIDNLVEDQHKMKSIIVIFTVVDEKDTTLERRELYCAATEMDFYRAERIIRKALEGI